MAEDRQREAEDASVSAWIDGAPASFDTAVEEAARLIRASALPVIAHLGADVAGAREAVLLADQAGGVIDHMASAALLSDLDPIRETGGFETTPLEAAVRADVALLIGTAFPAPDWLSRPARPHDEEIARRVIRLADGGAQTVATGEGASRLALLATLRARVKGRPVAGVSPAVEALAATLRGAKFGVAMWNAAELEPLAVEAIHGLVRDLNETTRFSTLAAPAPDNGLGVQTVCGWMTGFPLRTGFARGMPEHDPWRFDSKRLIASGETDCVIWVSALESEAAPPHEVAIALCAGSAAVAARVRFETSRGDAAAEAILYDPRAGALVARGTGAATGAPGVAATLAAIRERLARPPC